MTAFLLLFVGSWLVGESANRCVPDEPSEIFTAREWLCIVAMPVSLLGMISAVACLLIEGIRLSA